MTITATINAAGGNKAAAGGDAAIQLQHLRHHLKFQRQERCTHMRINWCTTITREQSRLHITREIHAKINLKSGLPEEGRHHGAGAQQDLKRLGRMVQNGERPGPGDLFRLSHRLRARIAQARYPHLRVPAYGREWIEGKRDRDHTPLVTPPQEDFPLEYQVGALRLERLREMLRSQGASPRRARTAEILDVLACGKCRGLCVPDYLCATQHCPFCGDVLHPEVCTVEVAVHRGTHEPVGSIEHCRPPHRQSA